MRVRDAGSPLCGWDLLCEPLDEELYEVLAARRLDVLLGDRPLQFNPPDGLGMWITADRVELSPLQGDAPVEIGIDRGGLYGDHIHSIQFEHEQDGDVGHSLDVEVFSSATQVALHAGNRTYTHTWFGEPDDALLDRLQTMSSEGDVDGLIDCIQGGADGRAKA